MSCSVDCRHGLDPKLLWCRLEAAAPVQPLALELPYSTFGPKKKKNEKGKGIQIPNYRSSCKIVLLWESSPPRNADLGKIILLINRCNFFSFSFFFFFLSFCYFRAAPAACGGSQARGLIGAVAAGLRQSHSSTGSKLRLRPIPQLTATPDPQPTERGVFVYLPIDRPLPVPSSLPPQYIVKCHGNTLLPQFLGMYRVSVDSEDSYMLVMRNMFSHRLPVHRKYDLKGSLVSREASDKEKVKELPTLKDMDFLNKNQKVYIGEEEKKVFLEKLKRDVEFLVQLKIMDYSLLLGIHDIVRGSELEEEGPVREEESEGDGDCAPTGPPALVGSYGTSPEGIGGYIHSHRPLGPGEFESFIDVYAIRSAEGAPQKEVYFMGLIDILTQYDAKKKAAHAAKTVKHGAGAEISTVHPEQYAKRFLDFITNIFA
uniref:Phosphatidylinositol 5-phosphate 4-kinase type-2 gamma n=1 Tax=Catagonus wagneri TaxID=51154 RepID=A0A8C3W6Q4_9CETA